MPVRRTWRSTAEKVAYYAILVQRRSLDAEEAGDVARLLVRLQRQLTQSDRERRQAESALRGLRSQRTSGNVAAGVTLGQGDGRNSAQPASPEGDT